MDFLDKRSIFTIELSKKKILLKLDLRYKASEDKIIDDYYLQRSLQSINYLLKHECFVVIISKISDDNVYNFLSSKIKNIKYLKHSLNDNIIEQIKNFFPSGVVLLESCHEIDLQPLNEKWCSSFNKVFDYFIYDSFYEICDKVNSGYGLIKYMNNISYLGFNISNEYRILKNLVRPRKSFTMFLGGNNLESSIKLVNFYSNSIDKLLLAGKPSLEVLAEYGNKNIFLSQTNSISPYVLNVLKICRNKIILPNDFIQKDKLEDEKSLNIDIFNLNPTSIKGDIGKKTLVKFHDILNTSNTILINGIPGMYEVDGFQNGTIEVFQAIANLTKKNVFTFLTGSTIRHVIKDLGYSYNDFSYISLAEDKIFNILGGDLIPIVAILE